MSPESNIRTVKVDLPKELDPSASGETIIIASTEGNVVIPGHEEAKVGVNVYRKKQNRLFTGVETPNFD